MTQEVIQELESLPDELLNEVLDFAHYFRRAYMNMNDLAKRGALSEN